MQDSHLPKESRPTATLVASAIALAIAGTGSVAIADDHEKEKCYGVAKAGENDCGNHAQTHSCAGQSTVDGDPGEWIALPAGLCEKLAGGSLEGSGDSDGA